MRGEDPLQEARRCVSGEALPRVALVSTSNVADRASHDAATILPKKIRKKSYQSGHNTGSCSNQRTDDAYLLSITQHLPTSN